MGALRCYDFTLFGGMLSFNGLEGTMTRCSHYVGPKEEKHFPAIFPYARTVREAKGYPRE